MKRERTAVEAPARHTYTNCSGPLFSSPSPITTKTIVDFIDALAQRFGDGYVFELEQITEGGIQMTSWPEKKDLANALKTLRFELGCKGPVIKSDTLERWRNEPSIAIWTAKRDEKLKGAIGLKAMQGAPCWTKREVSLIMDALNTVGFKCLKSSMPTNEDMKSFGELGDPNY